MTGEIIAVLIGYLLGSIPFGVLIGRLAKGIDVRDYGSGKMGTTNVLRSLGPGAAAAVLLLDAGKGVAAIFIARALGDAELAEAIAGIAAVVGHALPIFARFKGGRSVGTGLGGLFAIAPLAGAVALGAGVAVIAVSRYVSLGSMIGALSGAVAVLALAAAGEEPWAYFAYAGPVAAVIIMLHRDNIARLLRGQERKLGHKQGAPAKAPEVMEAR